METLKISDYAKYLEPGLKVQYVPNGKDYFLSNIGRYGDVHLETDELGAGVAERHNIKPYLRPLSCLNQEIEHKGEKFVPIKVLAQVAGYKGFYPNVEKNGNNFLLHLDDQVFVFSQNTFFLSKPRYSDLVLSNQNRFFQKMDEWQIWYGDQSLFQTGEILELKH